MIVVDSSADVQVGRVTTFALLCALALEACRGVELAHAHRPHRKHHRLPMEEAVPASRADKFTPEQHFTQVQTAAPPAAADISAAFQLLWEADDGAVAPALVCRDEAAGHHLFKPLIDCGGQVRYLWDVSLLLAD